MRDKFAVKMCVGVGCIVLCVLAAVGYISAALREVCSYTKAVIMTLCCSCPLGLTGVILFGDAYELVSRESRTHAEKVKSGPIFGKPHHSGAWTDEEEAVMS